MLIAAGADLSICNHDREGSMPLTTAAYRGRNAFIPILLDAHIARDQLHVKDKRGNTPLHVTAFNDLPNFAEKILKKRPNVVNIPSNNGKAALHDAAERGRSKVVNVLLKHGAEIDAKDNEGKTPLLWVSLASSRLSTVQIGFADIFQAVDRKHKDTVKILLDAGADPNIPTWKETIAHLAGKHGSVDILELLFANSKFDYTGTQQWGISGLHQAIFYKHNAAAMAFLKHDAKHGYKLLNSTNGWGNTPLYDCGQQGNLEMARALLESGKCDLSIRAKDGKTAMDIAKEKGHQEIVALLAQAETEEWTKIESPADVNPTVS